MTDRRTSMFPPNVYPSSQWRDSSEASQMYSSSAGHYPPSSYESSSSNDNSHNQGNSPHTNNSSYATADIQAGSPSASYTNTFYAPSPPYSSVGPSTSPSQQPLYPEMNPAMPVTQPSRPGHSHSHSHSNPLPQSSQSHMPSHSHPHSRSRSHSQTHPYLPQVSAHSPLMGHQMQATQYQTPLPFAQTISIPAQYPASPSRPFSCDMCALSFNRAHDLTRHRQTHTGEKPFLCNGGCGKSFTRRDALKRHQLVKQCGKIEEAWP